VAMRGSVMVPGGRKRPPRYQDTRKNAFLEKSFPLVATT
jgi:hypothetical protein